MFTNHKRITRSILFCSALTLTVLFFSLAQWRGVKPAEAAAPLTAFASCPAPQFGAPTNSAAGNIPNGAAVGDFDLDGKQDVAIANYATNHITVLLGDGAGSLQAGVNYGVGNNAYAVAVGYFNADNKPDLVVTNQGSAFVSVLLGNGTSANTFQPAVNYPTAPFASNLGVAVSDVNRDGKLDIVVAMSIPEAAAILLGNGDGTFQAATNYPAGMQPTAVVVGDFNRDGNQDLAVGNSQSNDLSLLKGNGDGTFQAQVTVGLGAVLAPQHMAVGDFDADGKLDLVTANRFSDNLSVLRGNGDGTFAAATNISLLSGLTSVAVGDFNADGKQDLAVTNRGTFAGDFNVAILQGDGAGAFAPRVNFGGMPDPPRFATVGDFNGDGKHDLVTANDPNGPGTASIFLNTCPCTPPDLTFTAPVLAQVCAGSTGNTISLLHPVAGESYLWSDFSFNGSISSGQGTPSITFTAGAMGTMTLKVTVTNLGGCTASKLIYIPINPLPTLGNYPPTVISTGGSTTVTPDAPPNQSTVNTVNTITATAPGFTGSLSVNKTTGVVTVNNAGPQGIYTVIVTATDYCGATADVGFTLTINCATITPAIQPIPLSGGLGTVNVAGPGGCAWTATTNAPWITVTGGGSGDGNGLVSYTVAANLGATPRVGSVTIAGQTFFVSQAAVGLLLFTDFSDGVPPPGWTVINGGTGGGVAETWASNPCKRLIPPTFSGSFAIVDSACAGPEAVQDEQLISPPFDATGLGEIVLQFNNQFQWFSGGLNEVGDVDVSTNGGVNWVNVLRMQGGDDGFPTPNTKIINLTPFIAANPANVRLRFHYYVTDLPLPRAVRNQASKPAIPYAPTFQELSWGIDTVSVLALTITPRSQEFTSAGDSGSINVTFPATYPLTAQSNDSWLTIAQPGGGTGSGSIGYVVSANTGACQRTGTITVSIPGAGQTSLASTIFTVTQDGVGLTIAPPSLPNGFVGTAYNQTVIASSGTLPYTFSVGAGALPGGLNLSADGVLSGTPTATGTFNFTVRATDQNNCSGERAYSLLVNPPCGTITLSPATLPNGFVGAVYNQTLTATGGTAPYTFAVTTGALPNGLNLAGGGALAGTPTTTGTFNFTVTATDNNSCTGTQAYALSISGNGLQFYPLPSPVRLLDTRANATVGCVKNTGPFVNNETRTLTARTACSTVPANATAIIGNITVVPSGPGFLTLFPSDATQPTVANSNFNAGEVTNNFFTVGLGATGPDAGAFKIFTSLFNGGTNSEVIIDVTGYYAPPGAGGLYYHPLPAPVRLLQTFPGQTGCFLNGSQQLQGQNDPNANPALDLAVDGRGAGLPSPCNGIPSDAVVLVGNATTVFPSAPLGFGYLTIYPSDAARPTVASSNYGNNDIINGPFAVKLGADGKFKVYTFSTTHLVIDISGYYSASANDANGVGLLFNPLPSPMRLLETRADFPGFPLTGCYRPNAPIAGGTGGIRTQQVWGTCADQPITIPNSSRAIVGNVTAINPTGAGFGTFFPGNVGTAPTVAVTNYPFPAVFGYNRHYYVGLGPTDGTFKILTQFTSDYIVDVSGYFAP